jgi:hypothetical protein
MSWDAIGAMGEWAGAIAVFVSLIYLAVQTGNNTRALRSAAFHQVRASFSEVSLAMYQDPSAVLLSSRVHNNEPDLTEEEIARYALLLTTFVRRGESAYFQSTDGSLQLEAWEGIRETILHPLSTEVGREWWTTVQTRFTKEYVDVLSSALDEKLSS